MFFSAFCAVCLRENELNLTYLPPVSNHRAHVWCKMNNNILLFHHFVQDTNFFVRRFDVFTTDVIMHGHYDVSCVVLHGS